MEATKPKRIRRVRLLNTDKKKVFGINPSFSQTYRGYCISKKIKKQDKLCREDAAKVARYIFREIRQQMEEKTGGVLIHKFGYFSVFYTYGHYSRMLGKTGSIPTLDHSGIRIRPFFIPHSLDRHFLLWTLDFSFNQSLYNNIRKNIIGGKEYKSYFYTLRKLLGRSPESRWHFKRKTVTDEHK